MSAVTETGPRILVVEDDAAIAELVRYNLEAEGLRSPLSPPPARRPSCRSPRIASI